MDKFILTQHLKLSDKEIFETLFKTKTVKIERIISNGQQSPKGFWYDQSEYEFVTVVEGFAVLEFKNGKVELQKNDCIVIKPHEKHRVAYTKKPTVWLCVFFK